MREIILPYKFTTPGGMAKAFHITLDWTIVNPNDSPVWVDSIITLVHRRGFRWVPGEADDEAWFKYHPSVGIGIDFALNHILPAWKAGNAFLGLGSDLMKSLGGSPGTGERMTQYNSPGWPQGASIEPSVKSTITAGSRYIAGPFGPQLPGTEDTAQEELMPRSKTSYQPTLSIPGPGASSGMREFWSNYDTPDFDIHWSIWQLPPQHRGAPYGGTASAFDDAIAETKLSDAIEIDLNDHVFAEVGEEPFWL
jgi:hypothetical protein